MKKIEWNAKKRWKVIQSLFFISFIGVLIWFKPLDMQGANFFIFVVSSSAVVLIGLNIADILKSKEKEKEEMRSGLKFRIARHEKELEELKKELEKLG